MTDRPEQRRRYLGRAQSLAERVRTYRTDEALEIDQADNYEIRRRRVFFDEILLVTLHSTRGGVLPWVPLILMLPVLFISLIVAAAEGVDSALPVGIPVLILLLLSGLLFLTPLWVVTVYGKRTRARMHFRMRQAKAREVYAEICRAASDAQRTAATRLAAEAPAPPPLPPPLPLSDSEPPPPPEEPPASP
ncbi:MAG TPA: hypothetical protein VN493_08880 [Thermoanaerobaculia bacterium]|nr:hypothetical protein [Thermoanaerobaculia bacterium]